VTYVALALCCALLCYGAINALASLGVALYWRLTSRRRASSLPAPSSVFLVRMFPAAVSSLFVTLFFLPGFLQFEPADTTETVSGLMLASVSAPLLVLVWGGLRGVLSWLKTDRLVQRWMSRAERRYLAGTSTDVYCIDSDFPVVSLAGVKRPRLFVSSRVMASCTQEELAGILAHEAAHHRSGDNLKRMLMRFCPDFLAWTSTAKLMERTWSVSSDLAADESAAGTDADARTNLASAIVKVARLAIGRSFPPEILASAFYRGESIDRRVRSLVAEPSGASERRYGWAWIAAGICVLSLALEPKVLDQVHRVTETVVHLLQ
jgi:Zn-dependent protease with chaperone function